MSRRGDATRASMIAAGVERVNQASLADFLAFLRPDDIADDAGRSKSTFFHHWPTMEAYLKDLAETAVNPMQGDAVSSVVAELGFGEGSSVETISDLRTFATRAFDVFTANPNNAFFLLANAATQDPEAILHLNAANAAIDEAIDLVLDAFLRTGERVPRDPFSVTTIVATFYAIALGLSIRSRREPDRFTGILFSDVVTGLMPALLTHDQGLDFDDYVERAMIQASDGDGSVEDMFSAISSDAPQDVLEAAATATSVLRNEVVPVAEKALDEAIAGHGGPGIDAAADYFLALHDVLAEHGRISWIATAIVANNNMSKVAATVSDPLRDSGLDGLTRRAVATTAAMAASPTLDHTVRFIDLSLMRSACHSDRTPIGHRIRTLRAMLAAEHELAAEGAD